MEKQKDHGTQSGGVVTKQKNHGTQSGGVVTKQKDHGVEGEPKLTLYTGLTSPSRDYVHTPLIEIAPVEDDRALREAVARLQDYDYLLFTSRHAVAAVVPLTAALPQSLRLVSIGPMTTAALRAHTTAPIHQVPRDDSRGVVAWFSGQKRGAVLLPRSSLALDIIPDGLRQQGYRVDTVTAYENRMPQKVETVDLRRIGRIVFTSPSTVDNFLRLYGALPRGVRFVTRGATTEHHLQQIIKQQQV